MGLPHARLWGNAKMDGYIKDPKESKPKEMYPQI